MSSSEKMTLMVVAGDGPSLLGRDWLKKIQLNWREIKAILSTLKEEVWLIFWISMETASLRN